MTMNSPLQTMFKIRDLLLDMNGRIGRLQFIAGVSTLLLLLVVLISALNFIVPLMQESLLFNGWLGKILSVVLFLATFGLFLWISLGLQVKRLHDFGWSGWWSIALYVFSILTILLALVPGGDKPNKFGAPQQEIPNGLLIVPIAALAILSVYLFV